MSGVGQDLTNIGPTYVNYKFTSYTGVIRKVPQTKRDKILGFILL